MAGSAESVHGRGRLGRTVHAAAASTTAGPRQPRSRDFPASFHDLDALLVGTGRRTPTEAERAELGALAAKLPLHLG
ncbi:hypothetical protein ACWKT3_19175 [Streptomyces violaceus]